MASGTGGGWGERDGFFKGQALGNDYIVVDAATLGFALSPAGVRLLCDRHQGVGGDGVVALLGVEPEGRRVQVWNPDGSLAEVSGNGLRIAALALAAGEDGGRETWLLSAASRYRVSAVRPGLLAIDLGAARVGPPRQELEVGARTLAVTAVDVGNPHAVVAAEDVSESDWAPLAAALAVHPRFPHGSNVERFQVLAPGAIAIRIHERGVGPTLASGTGACAAAAAAVALERVAAGAVQVEMPGGEVTVHVAAGGLRLEGTVTALFTGTLAGDLLARLAEAGA